MTSLEMLREFKVGLDKIDSSSYPEIYDEQIFMFINRFIISLVNAGRKVFEEDQVITDNLKALLSAPTKIVPTQDPNDATLFNVDLIGLDYYFYVKSYAITRITSDVKGKASVKVAQHDDIEVLLQDPFNKPKSYKIPITFDSNSITAYTDGRFSVEEFWLTFIRKPAIVSANVNCDLDEQLHYSIIEGAIALAQVTLGIRAEELNKQ
jgi:hypothetical protein